MESRQVRRAREREQQSYVNSAVREKLRRTAKRKLLERQTEREKSGFYTGSVASLISPSRSRVTKRKVKKGQPFGRIIRKISGMAYHATKGWRVA